MALLSPKSIMLAGPLARGSGQVSDRFAGVCDKLATFSGLKTCCGQDSAITTWSASRFETARASEPASIMDFGLYPSAENLLF